LGLELKLGELAGWDANQLTRLALMGNVDAFTELAQRFRPRLHGLLARKLHGHHGDIEDVAQEALAKAFHQLEQFDPQYQFSTWLYTIAMRLAVDRLRKDRRKPKLLAIDVLQVASHRLDGRELLEQQEATDNLWWIAREHLSEPQYTALWLRYGEELPLGDVGRVMGRSVIGVRVLIHRARHLLMPLLRVESQGEGSSFGQGD
jgi:RNA polymerase sigma-70 factor (ECF subfamily)